MRLESLSKLMLPGPARPNSWHWQARRSIRFSMMAQRKRSRSGCARRRTLMPESAEIRYRLAARPGRGRGALAKRANSDRLSPPLPRITHLMALAIKLEDMLREGVARNYSELGRLGHVSRAR